MVRWMSDDPNWLSRSSPSRTQPFFANSSRMVATWATAEAVQLTKATPASAQPADPDAVPARQRVVALRGPAVVDDALDQRGGVIPDADEGDPDPPVHGAPSPTAEAAGAGTISCSTITKASRSPMKRSS